MSAAGEHKLMVRVKEGEPTMMVQLLEVGGGEKSLLRAQPAKTGDLKQALARMSKKAGQEVSLVEESEDGSSSRVVEKGTNEESFTAPRRHLLLGKARVPITVNPPAVLAASLPKRIVCGCAVQPSLRLECSESGETAFRWWRLPEGGGQGVQVGEGRVYVPGEEDVGMGLAVEIIPRRGVEEGLAVRTGPEGAYSA
eukprot:CAMPEP_0174919784 /NCGR_PEP_ID=MMETSP1355-20121228/3857_1 /TAXON_ID=464990 /ORGANISM="Hemiselmis tepida, Strain CCMP443" /LENGTH=196 /DNA_ID=CAMNT_0016165027 /DNA_START=108 /DNA_END=695 /DNA_ORIENTATION=-